MGAPAFRVHVRRFGPVAVVDMLDERYPSDALDHVRALVEETVPEGSATPVIFNLRDVIFISTAILRVLAITHGRIGAAGGRLATAGGGEMVRHVLHIANFGFVEEYDDLRAALAALSPEGLSIFEREGAT